MNAYSALQQYRKVGVQTSVEGASPHRLIQMLLQGALEKIHLARAQMQAGAVAEKCTNITWALSIIGGLRGSLNQDAGGEIAANLDRLYEYMEMRLLEANAKNDSTLLEEVSGLLGQIKSAWDAIGSEQR